VDCCWILSTIHLFILLPEAAQTSCSTSKSRRSFYFSTSSTSACPADHGFLTSLYVSLPNGHQLAWC
jgi:hypothetical protein